MCSVSSRTLEVGSVQVMVPLLLVTLEQCPVAEEPFTDISEAES